MKKYIDDENCFLNGPLKFDCNLLRMTVLMTI